MSVTLTPYAGLDNSTVENPEALYLVGGSETDLDGKLVRAVVFVDPTTAQAMVPGSVTFTSLSIADGSDVAQGHTTDDSSDPTVIGLLTAIKEQTLAAPVAAQTHSYSTTGAGTTVDVTDEPVLAFSLQVTSVTTGTTATSWTVLVEGSLDGTNWATVLTHAKPTDAEAAIKHTVGFPVRYLRANVSALTLGVTATAISVSLLGKS